MANFSSDIEIKGSKRILEAYYNALKPEADEKVGRGDYSLKLQKDKLIITITADDASAFRAVLTSLLGLISIVEKSAKA